VLVGALPVALEVGLQAPVLGPRDGEAVEVAVDVSERARDAVDADLERPQDRRSDALDPVQRPIVGLAEVDRDQREREQNEDAHDDAAPECAARAGRIRRGSGALAWGSQDREPRAGCAGARHELRLEVNALLGSAERRRAQRRCTVPLAVPSAPTGRHVAEALAAMVVAARPRAAVDRLELLQAPARADGDAGERA